MLSIDKKTGEIKVSPYSKFMHDSTGIDCSNMIIVNHDFSWDDDTRDFIVIETGKEDRQAYIDSFAEECGVYNVLKLYAKSGDLSLLNRTDGFYGDISDLPVDELNPAKMEAAAKESVSKLSTLLGRTITAEELSKMSGDEIDALIAEAVAAKTASSETPKESEGE